MVTCYQSLSLFLMLTWLNNKPQKSFTANFKLITICNTTVLQVLNIWLRPSLSPTTREPLKSENPPFLSIPPWLIPPPLWPDGEQGLGQPFQTQTRQGRSHGEPHVTRPSLTCCPCCSKNQLCFLQGAVQQTDLKEKNKNRINKDEKGEC